MQTGSLKANRMFKEDDIVRLKVEKPWVGLSIGATGYIMSTYIEGLDAVEVIFERKEKGEIQLLVQFNEIKLLTTM